MRRETRQLYNQMLGYMAESYEVTDTREQFTATEPMAQSFNDAVQESSAFLQQISVIPVVDILGELVILTVPSSVAKRTNVSDDNPRKPQIIGGMTDRKYECKLTEFDVGISYALMDTWARYGNLHTRYMPAIYKRIALDRIMIGWHGNDAAAETDRETYTKLEDVNKGWLYDLKTNLPGHYYLGENTVEEGDPVYELQIGETGEYQNINQLVYSVGSLIEDKDRTGNEVAIIGRGFVAKDMNKILAKHAETPSEMIHFDILSKSYGGYKSVMVPNFPEYGLLVTDPKNLQIYYQLSSMRRQSKDQPEYNRVVDFISQNEAYMIGELAAAAAIEAANVKFV